MPKQEGDKFIFGATALSQYRRHRVPADRLQEIEGLRTSLGREVPIKSAVPDSPRTHRFRAPTPTSMAIAFERLEGDMKAVRLLVMDIANHLDDNPLDDPTTLVLKKSFKAQMPQVDTEVK